MALTLALAISSPSRTMLLLLITIVNASKVAKHMLVGHAAHHNMKHRRIISGIWNGMENWKLRSVISFDCDLEKTNYFLNLINIGGGSSFAIDKRRKIE